MTDKNFTSYFHEQLEKVKDDLFDLQYETLADTANMAPAEIATMILALRTDTYQQELDWLYSLTQPSITKCITLVNSLFN
jgi:hypothetical protein